MNRRVIFATANQGKVREVKEILKDFPFEIYSMKEAGITCDVEENGTSFEDNAIIKVNAIREYCPDDIIIADDSGLEVDYLNKEPGIYSARYMGEDTSYEIKMQSILDKLIGVPDKLRTARFVAAVAAYVPQHGILCVRGIFEGRIGYEMKGKYGFGYDPIFFVPERNCYSAELLPEEKNKISHRASAIMKMAQEFNQIGLK